MITLADGSVWVKNDRGWVPIATPTHFYSAVGVRSRSNYNHWCPCDGCTLLRVTGLHRCLT